VTLCECEVGVRYYAKLQIKPLGSSLCFLRFLVSANFFRLASRISRLTLHSSLITHHSLLITHSHFHFHIHSHTHFYIHSSLITHHISQITSYITCPPKRLKLLFGYIYLQALRNSTWFFIFSAGLVAMSFRRQRICSPTE